MATHRLSNGSVKFYYSITLPLWGLNLWVATTRTKAAMTMQQQTEKATAAVFATMSRTSHFVSVSAARCVIMSCLNAIISTAIFRGPQQSVVPCPESVTVPGPAGQFHCKPFPCSRSPVWPCDDQMTASLHLFIADWRGPGSLVDLCQCCPPWLFLKNKISKMRRWEIHDR